MPSAICPTCNYQTDKDELFCCKCGTKLVPVQQIVFCRSCGAKLKPNVQYCSQCGTKRNTEFTPDNSSTTNTVLADKEIAYTPRGRTIVTIDKLARRGTKATGSVMFGSGASGNWYIDETGGVMFEKINGKPDHRDIREFHLELQRCLYNSVCQQKADSSDNLSCNSPPTSDMICEEEHSQSAQNIKEIILWSLLMLGLIVARLLGRYTGGVINHLFPNPYEGEGTARQEYLYEQLSAENSTDNKWFIM